MHCSQLVVSALVAVAAGIPLPAAAQEAGTDAEAVALAAQLDMPANATVEVQFEIGGHLIVLDAEGKTVRLPLAAEAELCYQQCLLSWSDDPQTPARDLRRYTQAAAQLKSDAVADRRTLSEPETLLVAEVGPGGLTVNGLYEPLTREEAELLDACADALTLDRLLPGRPLHVGEAWDHTAASIGALVGLDRVESCTASSRVTGVTQRQVQLEMSGTVAGKVDGTATQMDLKAAYLFHLDEARITKFNLAIREQREPGGASPGLDATAKVAVVVRPSSDAGIFSAATKQQARDKSSVELDQLRLALPERGYEFFHENAWLVTSRQPELLSLRLLREGQVTAHCNVMTLPERRTDKAPTLPQFERDIRSSLGEKLKGIAAAKQWQSSAGNRVMGIFCDGLIEEIPVQWRYYLLERKGAPRVSLVVTVEHSQLEAFADADRLLVDSLELAPPEATSETARRSPSAVR